MYISSIEFISKNYRNNIMVNNERIGTLEVCYLSKKRELEEGLFLKEVKNLIAAIAESIAQIVERESNTFPWPGLLSQHSIILSEP